ncbi:MAG: uroporphyrinogen-III synthase [Verrucomicrobiota bacterium]|nr:uroporphyrinogen-III synthase [Verrucomicrobiota bacterium]
MIQTADAIRRFGECLPGIGFETILFSSPGDRDRAADLRDSPPDFFTRDLDEAVAGGGIDLAIHSAKDLSDPLPAGLDWCWLPWREDPRDALVLPAGRDMASLPAAPRVGISSARRETWRKSHFPAAQLLLIRGDIETRLAQLDEGRYDIVIMASAALIRLGLQHRISRWIPADELRVPDGQGALAMTFRAGDTRLLRLRSLFVKPAVFAGAGTGRAGACTMETTEALKIADVCLHDAIMDDALLRYANLRASLIDVGKRCGSGGQGQETINDLIAGRVRRGERVVRLKGGDPGVFGRLAEEVESLESLGLPYRVLPGVSSLLAATTGTGMLLTRRGESRGFRVMTPRVEGGRVASVGSAAWAGSPQVYFMATNCARDVLTELRSEGMSPDTPAAFVFDAGAVSESVVRGVVKTIADQLPPDAMADKSGLLIVGEAARHGYVRTNGALGGRRILLTCSEALQPEAVAVTHDLGGIPVSFPTIRLAPVPAGLAPLRGSRFDWLVLTSPSAVNATIAMMKETDMDLRTLPPILVCGSGAARALKNHGLRAASRPAGGFGSESLLALARGIVRPGQQVLRLRSDAAGNSLARDLQATGAIVTDSVIARNEPISRDSIPPFDAVLFASRSAVLSFLTRYEQRLLNGRLIAAIGRPTADELERRGIAPVLVGREATVGAAIEALAAECVRQSLLKERSHP